MIERSLPLGTRSLVLNSKSSFFFYMSSENELIEKCKQYCTENKINLIIISNSYKTVDCKYFLRRVLESVCNHRRSIG